MSPTLRLFVSGADGLVGRAVLAAAPAHGVAAVGPGDASDARLLLDLVGPCPDGPGRCAAHALPTLLTQGAGPGPVVLAAPAHRLGPAGTVPTDPLACAALGASAALPDATVAWLHDPWGDGAAPGEGGIVQAVRDAVDQGPVPTPDHGYAPRHPTHATDLADALLRLVRAAVDGPPLPSAIHVGHPTPVLVRDLVDRLGGTLVDGDAPWAVPCRQAPEPGLLADLGWSPDRTIAEIGPPRAADLRIIRPIYEPDDALLARFRTSLDRGMASNGGPEVRALEDALALALHAPHALAVSSGAAGLEVAARALDRSGGTGAAILPAWTYVATLNAVQAAGLRPVFADVDPATWTMDPRHVAQLLERHPDVSLIVPVVTYGVHPDMEALGRLARAHGAALLVDAAHAVGATIDGRCTPPQADASVFSLHATKVLPATEGGAITCHDPALAARMDVLRTHGNTPEPLDHVHGLNAKLDELAAATARHGLARLPAQLAARAHAWDRMRADLVAAGWTVQHVPSNQVPNGQNLCAIPPVSRDRAVAVLSAHKIGWRRYFHPPLHHLRRLSPADPLPETERLDATLMCLPLHARMTAGDLTGFGQAVAAVGRLAQETP